MTDKYIWKEYLLKNVLILFQAFLIKTQRFAWHADIKNKKRKECKGSDFTKDLIINILQSFDIVEKRSDAATGIKHEWPIVIFLIDVNFLLVSKTQNCNFFSYKVQSCKTLRDTHMYVYCEIIILYHCKHEPPLLAESQSLLI